MPDPNPRRAERAATRAAELVGRRLPSAYPDRLADRLYDVQGPHRLALWQRHQEVARQLLEQAIAARARADEAIAAAVEAARHGYLEPSWADLGEVLALSPAGAHKRFRHVEGPEAQSTIDDYLPA